EKKKVKRDEGMSRGGVLGGGKMQIVGPQSLAQNLRKLTSSIKSRSDPGQHSSNRNARWTDHENEQLSKAVKKHGYGNWKQIAYDIPGRTSLQVKNHARHLAGSGFHLEGAPGQVSASRPALASGRKRPPPPAASVDDDEVEIDITDDEGGDDDVAVTGGGISLERLPSESEGEDSEGSGGGDVSDEEAPRLGRGRQDADSSAGDAESMGGRGDSSPASTIDPEPRAEPIACESSLLPKVAATDAGDGVGSPGSEADALKLDLDDMEEVAGGDAEEAAIRNHILDAWTACAPRYLTKTSVRPGLRGEGDVNAIGRVHDYLESVGAINAGAVRGVPRPVVRKGGRSEGEGGDSGEEEGMEEGGAGSARYIFEGESRRRRRVRDSEGNWVEEGTTPTTPGPDDDEAPPRPTTRAERLEASERERLLAVNAKYFALEYDRNGQPLLGGAKASVAPTAGVGIGPGNDALGKYDPFCLIPTRRYSRENPAPFHVDVRSNAMLVMDFHSHLAHTEIIGLLGGIYDPVARTLSIEE
ncbi:hypothetical protein BDK51DRAFT_33322, partial [Blyttiomyces helicus]